MRHVGQHRYRHRRLPSMRRVANIGIGAASPTTGLDVFADNRSGCVRRRQVWMYSPTTGLDVFAGDRSGCIRRQQVTPRRLHRAPGAGRVRARIRAHARSRSPAPAIRSRSRAALRRRSHSSARAPGDRHGSRPPRATHGHMQGSTGAPDAYPRARSVEVTRARYPIPGPRRTSPPFPLVRAGARGSPRLTGAARNARAHAGQPWSARRARAWIFFFHSLQSSPGLTPIVSLWPHPYPLFRQVTFPEGITSDPLYGYSGSKE